VPRKNRSKAPLRAKVDPTLVRQLKDTPAESTVGAVFTLKSPAGEPVVSPASAREAMEKIVREAADVAQAQPARVTMFPNVQSFAVYGPPALVRSVARHANVASAIANKQNEDMLIRPVAKRRTRAATKKKR
jgi:hypothetical protein